MKRAREEAAAHLVFASALAHWQRQSTADIGVSRAINLFAGNFNPPFPIPFDARLSACLSARLPVQRSFLWRRLIQRAR